jgi:hypothetical protein
MIIRVSGFPSTAEAAVRHELSRALNAELPADRVQLMADRALEFS